MALEWLLIFGAVAGLAASTALVVQRVADDTAERPADPGVRLIDAEIAAAHIAAEATTWRQGLVGNQLLFMVFDPDTDYASYQQACQDVRADFDDVVAGAAWYRPLEYNENDDYTEIKPFLPSHQDYQLWFDGKIKKQARCEVTPHAGLYS